MTVGPSPAPDQGDRHLPAPLLPLVLVAFAANSLITRHVVADGLLDAGLLTGVRFTTGAAALLVLTLARSERPAVGRANLVPALWLGLYAVCISYGYASIGAAAGTFVFYASVLLTLVASDLLRGDRVPLARGVGAFVSLSGLGVLASGSTATVTLRGVLLLTVTGVAWGLYTQAGRAASDPRVATTGHFVVLGSVLVVPTVIGAGAGLQVTGSGVVWAAGMGAGTTACAYVAWYACQRSLSGAAAGSVQLVIPVITAVGAVVLLGERLAPRLLLAAGLVLGGMWLGRTPASTVSQVGPRPCPPGSGRRPG